MNNNLMRNHCVILGIKLVWSFFKNSMIKIISPISPTYLCEKDFSMFTSRKMKNWHCDEFYLVPEINNI